MTKVKFYMELNGCLAVFPEMIHSFNGYRKDDLTCYSHIGQHSACHPDYLKGKKEANFNQYRDLLRELIGQGYKDLQIENKQEFEYHRQPTAYELKFGYGGTLYRNFRLADIGITETGDLKQWFKADDGLRYYR